MRDIINPPAIHGEAVAGQEAARSSLVMKELETLTKGIEKETFGIAELLAEVKTNRYYEAWNYENFGAYVKTALAMKERKAYYLVRMITVSEVMGIPRAKYEPLGIFKVREIFSLDPNGFYINNAEARNEPLNEHILRLLAEAPGMSTEQVQAEVRRLKGLDGENTLVWARVKMPKLAKEQVYDKAIELAKAKLGSAGRDDEGNAVEYSDGTALEAICQDFLSDPNNQPDEEEPE